MSTPGGVHYTGGLSGVHWGDTKMHVGGYHEYSTFFKLEPSLL